MSIGASTIGALPNVADVIDPTTSKPPKKRQVTARADAVQQPEAR